MKVLAVDDDPTFLELLTAVLASAGFNDVTQAFSAPEAAQAIVDAKPPFDCCFIDMRMPEIEGDYLCRWIRRLPEYRDKVILMITATAEKRDVERAFMAGATDYMTKPMDLTELIARARQIARSGGNLAPAKGRKQADEAPQEPPSPAFSDPIRIEGVKRAIELTALENYLFQLSRSSTDELSAVAFRMPEAASLHLRCSDAEFGQVLVAASRAILAHAKLPHPFIAYAGYGVFVIVSDAAEADEDEREEIGARISADLAAAGLAQADRTPISVSVRMMEPQKLGSRTGQQMVEAMYRTVVDAETTTLGKRLTS